ncbi:MAG: 4-hydroxy-tetrahydrodipicolinate synthase [Desulfobacteraceae bacterium]|nr:4-hydroxy-tetrahydrodipicolinate synthase [Desulfobacteraceae bacterium]
MKKGCYTALITPFDDAGEIDNQGLEQLINFQIENGITGILAAGTTGESPTLKWEEHNLVVQEIAKHTKNKCASIAGAGSNNTAEALNAVEHAAHAGFESVLLVDPYYNGPGSLETRKEYYEPIAKTFPQMDIIPYIIPGRTGSQMLPQDLAILSDKYSNVSSVKEATGNFENMYKTRKYCNDDFTILSGDDPIICKIMTDPAIKAAGGISVMSNIAPKFLTEMISLLDKGETDKALAINEALTPLLNIITVITEEETQYGTTQCRARNPLAVKTLMQILGMPSGYCRKPVGKMTTKGLSIVVKAAQQVWKNNPEIFAPIADFFKIDIDERLNNKALRKNFVYDY